MRVLVACESSGTVREAFRKRGHDAYSADILPADDGSPFHIQGDVLDHLDEDWDLMIGHPPCTYLCNSGVRWQYEGGKANAERNNFDAARVSATSAAADFFLMLRNAPIPGIALENPIMHRYARSSVGEPSQYIQPWHHGDPAFKGTGLWLKNLPLLVDTNRLTPPKPGTPEHKAWSAIHMAPPGPDRWKIRSKTFQGIANAMAEQWG